MDCSTASSSQGESIGVNARRDRQIRLGAKEYAALHRRKEKKRTDTGGSCSYTLRFEWMGRGGTGAAGEID